MSDLWINLSYLLASCLFIFGLKMLSSPRTAPRGNLIAAVGMLIAIITTLLDKEVIDFTWIIAGLLVGSAIGAIAAQRVKMTAMPQMVALFNGLGGGGSMFVAWSELANHAHAGTSDLEPVTSVPIGLSCLIGAVTLTGSLIAFAKLQELMSGKPVLFPLQKLLNGLLLIGAIVLTALLVIHPENLVPFYGLLVVSSVLGVLSVIPIGGADMPVVISLLNSYSGLAACSTGFVLQNNALIISGSLVGASGIILTQIMCKAMNRSLANVLFAGVGSASAAAGAGAGPAAASGGTVKQGSPDDAAMILDASQFVIFVPGYGMAVAQAQHVVRELADLLQKKGIQVKYAIHPVAGRMPGHMNVLLAEADVPYDQLCDMDEINPQFPHADVAMVIGANDVTNPAARHDTASPIYGMPILDVDKAATAMVLKRSMRPGFAGVNNELYTRERTMMVFGDAKETITNIIRAIKEL